MKINKITQYQKIFLVVVILSGMKSSTTGFGNSVFRTASFNRISSALGVLQSSSFTPEPSSLIPKAVSYNELKKVGSSLLHKAKSLAIALVRN